ncbi:hypothetical protein [Paraburkholderia sp. HP33-1]|uniref:hypothetical protein n=1 Tax=Paraburkholderia sp. HP33-1 TaxID=2883243 RepID=UPI001F323DFD|nr:hypothetical protein [Paraburkholderia sp. HP33-1]
MNTNCKKGLAVILSILTSAASAQKIEIPQQGSTSYVTYYINHVISSIDMDDQGNDEIIESFGITRNTSGQKIFDNMSVHCVFYYGMHGGTDAAKGACTEMDADGDKVFTTFVVGTHTLIGGTGKYTGITGAASFTVNMLRPPAEGTHADVVDHKVSWKINK